MLPVRVRWTDGLDESGGPAGLVNLSRTGAALVVKRPVATGVELTLEVEHEGLEASTRGRVVLASQVGTNLYRVNLAFPLDCPSTGDFLRTALAARAARRAEWII
jgi:hypothetical protein